MTTTATKLEAVTYWVAVPLLQKAFESLRRISNKAEKFGAVPILMEETGETKIERKPIYAVDPITGRMTLENGKPKIVDWKIYHFAEVRVTGEPPTVEGDWHFVATLQHDYDTGTIIKHVPWFDADAIPEDFRTATADRCDHCNARRKRRDTYVVYNREDGTWKVLGGTCIRDFFGGLDPHKAVGLCEIWVTADDLLNSMGHWPGAVDLKDRLYSLERFLTHVASEIRQNGWMSKGAARDKFYDVFRATAWRAWDAMLKVEGASVEIRKLSEELRDSTDPEALMSDLQSFQRTKVKILAELTEADAETAREAIAFGQAIDPDTDSDYLHNLRVVAEAEAVGYRTSGIGASMITATKRAAETRRQDEKKAAKPSKHVGKIGERITFGGTVVFDKYIDGRFGMTHLLKFEDADGNAFTWFNSSPKGPDVEPAAGDVVEVTGTVKKHDEFRGTKQTMINRCRVKVLVEVVA